MTPVDKPGPGAGAPRPASGADKESSLVPMLIWGLVLITLSMLGVMLFF